MKLHGYNVISACPLPDSSGTRKDLHVLLVDRGAMTDHQRYVTCLWCTGDSEWMQGHYISSRKEAYEDYTLRINQNMPPDPPIESGAAVTIICCPTFAIYNMAGRGVAHSAKCANRRP
jgi:hypothetical protein